MIRAGHTFKVAAKKVPKTIWRKKNKKGLDGQTWPYKTLKLSQLKLKQSFNQYSGDLNSQLIRYFYQIWAGALIYLVDHSENDDGGISKLVDENFVGVTQFFGGWFRDFGKGSCANSLAQTADVPLTENDNIGISKLIQLQFRYSPYHSLEQKLKAYFGQYQIKWESG